MIEVTTPVVGFSGISAGVNFTDGVAHVDPVSQSAALRYFRGAGYGIQEISADEPDDEPDGSQGDGPPRKSGSTEAWRTYFVEHRGMPEAEAAELSRDQLVERYTSEENQS